MRSAKCAAMRNRIGPEEVARIDLLKQDLAHGMAPRLKSAQASPP
jgi:hypothetical protein